MKQYTEQLYSAWEKSIALYEEGEANIQKYFNEEESNFLSSCGISKQEMFDYAEDYARYAEPDFLCVTLIQDVRRAYFLEVQKGVHSDHVLNANTLPSKEASIKGIDWLPRILPKARAKLRGELSDDSMYSCGGDRKFFKDNNIHPAELLRAVWFHGDDDHAIIDWVAMRRKETSGLFSEIKKFFN